MSKQLLLRPLGLITEPNKLGEIPLGALSQAEGVYIRSPGTVESALAPALRTIAETNSTSGEAFIFLSGTQKAIVYKNASTGFWRVAWDDGTTVSFVGLADTAAGVDQELDVNGRVGWSTTGSHTVLSCLRGTLVFDSLNPSSTAERTPRMAGLYAPIISLAYAGPLNPLVQVGAIPQNKYCHVVAIFRRKFSGSDPYEIVSAPSPCECVYATYDTPPVTQFRDIDYSVLFDTRFARAGDEIQFYRTRAQDFVSAASIITATNTGADYYLSKTITLTSSQASSGSLSVTDSTPDESLGEALYTNDGVQGAESAALPPPTSKCIARFKGHTFYLNTIEAPFFKIKSPTFWGNRVQTMSADFRARSYGSLQFTGTTSSGSPTITAITAGVTDDIVVGQAISASSIGGYVVSKTATTVTVTNNASSSAVGTSLVAYDVFEIDGVKYSANDVPELAYQAMSYVYALSIANVFVHLNSSAFSNVQTSPADFVTVTRKNYWGTSSSVDTMSVRATRGNLLEPPLPQTELGEAAKAFSAKYVTNGIRWSEENQPENCPSTNAAFCGSGVIYAAAATRDAMWIFASDGLWRLSGTGGQAGRGYDWRIDPVDPTLIIAGPQALCVLRDSVYALTSRGLVRVDSDGSVVELSHGKVGDQLRPALWSDVAYSTTTGAFIIPDDINNEVRIRQASQGSNITWVYNASTDAFTQYRPGSDPIHGAWDSRNNVPVTLILASNTFISTASDTSTYANFAIAYQPAIIGDPFSMYHWQTVNVAFETTTAQPIVVSANGTTIGSRVLATTGSSASIYYRTSFGVPRSAPACSNTIQIGVAASSLSTSRLKLQGVEVVYEPLTDQRKER